MTIIKLSEAKAHLGKYSKLAADGAVFVISNRNQPMAKLGPATDDDRGRCPKVGLLAGQCRISEDFDAPLPDLEKDYYGA
jgi:antitoxin (DNA-binding transcriptional repressor) of toxin-antitoxin stability system